MYFDAGYGLARNDLELRDINGPLIESGDRTKILQLRGGVLFPVSRQLKVGASATFTKAEEEMIAKVLASGATFGFGRPDYWVFAVNLTAPIFSVDYSDPPRSPRSPRSPRPN